MIRVATWLHFYPLGHPRAAGEQQVAAHARPTLRSLFIGRPSRVGLDRCANLRLASCEAG